MRPSQPRLMWLAFAAAVTVVIAAMGWTTAAVLRLDRSEAESRRHAQLEENVRLALWRMDSALAPFIAAEHARPAEAFGADDDVVEQVGDVDEGNQSQGTPPRQAPQTAARIASMTSGLPLPPLPGTDGRFVRAYFQYDGEGRLTSAGAEPAEKLRQMAAVASRPVLIAALPPPTDAPPDVAPVFEPTAQDALANAAPLTKGQVARNTTEYQARRQSAQQQQVYAQTANRMANRASQEDGPQIAQTAGAPAMGTAMQPVWLKDDLLLARRVMLDDEEVVQGAWLDWTAVKAWLLKSSADLLPSAQLVPHPGGAADPESRLLASLPVRLVPGELAAPGATAGVTGGPRQASPLRTSLLVAWVCVLLASAAVAVLLRGVVSLSERRGAFVSAVTHELRTPLTTLRMYTEMLADGMVADPAQRESYLATLRAEADRLGHLVENVLAYSRLERNRAGYQVTTVKLIDILPRAVERLAERARHAGMTLSADVRPDITGISVRTNALALEQILFNLVDNACKYAGAAAHKRIELTASAGEGEVHVRVRDHGPGVAADVTRRLFHPFSKSVKQAAETAPGLGLGLALSRRLAQSMGGDLRHDGSTPAGASFVVTLPRA